MNLNALIRRARGWLWLASALVLGAAHSHAAPAPWYWWVSKVDGKRFCAQTLPASGWVRAEGPYRRADCKGAPLRP